MIKETTTEQSEERDYVGSSLKLKIAANPPFAPKKSHATTASKGQGTLSKIDSSKGSKNSSKISGAVPIRQKGKILLDKIMSQRDKSKQKVLKKTSTGSKKSLKGMVPSLNQVLFSGAAFDSIRDTLKKTYSQNPRSDCFETGGSETKSKTGGFGTEVNPSLVKFKKNMIENSNKYLKRIGKKNNLFEMRKYTEREIEAQDAQRSGSIKLASSVMHDDGPSMDSPGGIMRGLYESGLKTVSKSRIGYTSPTSFYNLFQAKSSIEDMGQSIDSQQEDRYQGQLVNPELENAMEDFKNLLRAALASNERSVSRSLRKLYPKK